MTEILDINHKTVEAACTFNYKGYTISTSTIVFPPSTIVMPPISGSHYYEAVNVEDAIEWVERQKS